MNLERIMKKASGPLDVITNTKNIGCDCGDDNGERYAAEAPPGTGLEDTTEGPITYDGRPDRELDEEHPGENLTEFFPEFDDRNDAANNRKDEGDRVGFLAPVSAEDCVAGDCEDKIAGEEETGSSKGVCASCTPFRGVEYNEFDKTLGFEVRATEKRYLLYGISRESADKFMKNNRVGRGRTALAAVKPDVLRHRSIERTNFSLASQHSVANWPM